jgi:hypothetical protein
VKVGHKGHLNTRNKFPNSFFPNPKIFLPILDKLEEPRFWGKWEKSAKSRGQSHAFTPRLEVDDEARPSTQTHVRNQRKTPPNTRMKNQAKILRKTQKRKMIHTT